MMHTRINDGQTFMPRNFIVVIQCAKQKQPRGCQKNSQKSRSNWHDANLIAATVSDKGLQLII